MTIFPWTITDDCLPALTRLLLSKAYIYKANSLVDVQTTQKAK